MRHPASDAGKILFSFLFAPMAFAVLILGLAFLGGRCSKADATITALRDTIRITDSVEVVRAETVTVRQRRVDTLRLAAAKADSAVTILNDSTAVVQDTGEVELPKPVIADIRVLRATVTADSALILSLYQHDTTQQWRIQSRDKLIAHLSKRRLCGIRCGVVVGVAAGILLHKAVR